MSLLLQQLACYDFTMLTTEEIFRKTGFQEMTEVQKKAIPLIESHRNLFIQAHTGAGKTYTYLLPAIARINAESGNTQVLIIAPTRELAVQIGESAQKLCPFFNVHAVVCIGGLDIERQFNALKHRPHLVIGTPGRLNDLLKQGKLDLNHISMLIMDEADQIISTGQKEEVLSILDSVSHSHQTIALSATFQDSLSEFLPEDTEKLILSDNSLNQNIDSFFVETDDKNNTLLTLLEHLPITSAIVFTNYKNDANEISEILEKRGILSSAFSSFFEERKRLAILKKFKEGRIRILCATDAAARGLDISDVSHIIHYDIPSDFETFIHRSGRTAHQNNHGMNIVLLSHNKTPEESAILDICKPLALDMDCHSDLTVPAEKKIEDTRTMVIRIHAGRKDKIRPKDVIGALCTLMDFKDIGTLEIQDSFSSVILLRKDLSFPDHITIKGKNRKLSIWND